MKVRANFKRSTLRRSVYLVATGGRETLNVDLSDAGVDLPRAFDEAAAQFGAYSVEFQRIAMGLKRTGAYDTVVDQLAAADPLRRRRSARLAGALRLEQAVPWLGGLLRATDAQTRQAAARALGRIGGARSAEILLRAACRRPMTPSLVISLAHASPDLFLETALDSRPVEAPREVVAVAAGLRRRMASVRPLLDLLASGTPRERAAARRALRSLGVARPVPRGMAA
jgi:HEAT repeat protein